MKEFSDEMREQMGMIGARILLARKRAKISQRQLTDRLPFVKFSGTISRWEAGKQVPHATQFPAVADALGVSLDYLLRGKTD